MNYTEGWPVAEAELFYKVIRALDQAYRDHGTEYEEPPDGAVISDNPARDAFRASMGSKGK